MFYSNSSDYPILNRSTIPEYPWLAWNVLYSEMKQKKVEDLWFKTSREMIKHTQDSSGACLKVWCFLIILLFLITVIFFNLFLSHGMLKPW